MITPETGSLTFFERTDIPPYKEDVGGSIPSAPTLFRGRMSAIASAIRPRESTLCQHLARSLGRGAVAMGLLGALMVAVYFTGAADTVEWPTGVSVR